MKTNPLLTTALVLALSSCFEPTGGPNQAEISDGPIADKTPRTEVLDRQQAFKLDFVLSKNGEWLELRTHASRAPQLQGGLQLRFTRLEDSLFLNVRGPRLNGDKQIELVKIDPAVGNDDRFTFYIDVHNNERPADLVFWFISHDFTLTSDCSNCRLSNAWIASDNFDLYPSDFPEYYRSGAQGVGRSWGTFRSRRARLLSASVMKPILQN